MSDFIAQMIELQNIETNRKNQILIGLVQRITAKDETLTPAEALHIMNESGTTIEGLSAILFGLNSLPEMQTELASLEGSFELAMGIIEQEQADADTFQILLNARTTSRANNQALLTESIAKTERANVLRSAIEGLSQFVVPAQATAV